MDAVPAVRPMQNPPMRLLAIPAFEDNYIWALADDDGDALIVDPGDAAPVIAATGMGLWPAAVLITHHHADHCGGVAALRERWPTLPVFAPEDPRIPEATERVGEGSRIALKNWKLSVLAVPGHTSSHIAFHGGGQDQPHLFCGDTLFSLGCGRMFEGTPPQMLASLDRLAALPDDTTVCCGHEYTLSNATFARTVDPANPVLLHLIQEAQAMRQSGRPTLPSTLARETAANPFLRTGDAVIRAAVARHFGHSPEDRVETFAGLRRWKDDFRG